MEEELRQVSQGSGGIQMSEVEAHDLVDIQDYRGEVYLKSEADKVIAELKESVKGLILDNYLKDKETRRHKYKRCLAMARASDASMAYFGEFYDDASKRMVAHYYKWRGRWYELAEKFKEVK
jgi:hypothetical protein